MSPLLAAGVLIAALVQKAEKFHEVCGVCHSEIAEDFVSHAHSRNGLDCDSCHGESLGHRRAEGGSPPDRLAGPREIPTLCGGCHAGDAPESIGDQFRESKHGIALASESRVRAPHCGTCHGVHRVRPAPGVEVACKRCHESRPVACEGAAPKSSPISCVACHEPHR